MADINLVVSQLQTAIDTAKAVAGAPANQAPNVVISIPTFALVLGATVTITASASDPDGTIAKVMFFNGATRIGEVLAAPYVFNFSPTSIGSYQFTAIAVDNLGAQSSSNIISVEVFPASTGSTPAWRAAMPTKDTWYSLTGTEKLNGVIANLYPTDNQVVDAWIGYSAGPDCWWNVAPGGHATTPFNGVLKIDFSADVPRWAIDFAGSPRSVWPSLTVGDTIEYYSDGLPTSRHSCYANWFIPEDNRVFMLDLCAAYGGVSHTRENVDAYEVTTKKYDPAGTYPLSGLHQGAGSQSVVASIAIHPLTHDAYAGNNGLMRKWTRATKTWSNLPIWMDEWLPNHFSPQWQFNASVIDAKRDRWCYIDIIKKNLECADLTTYKLTRIPITGPLATATGLPTNSNAMTIDEDNDRLLLIYPDGRQFAVNPTTGVSAALPNGPVSPNGAYTRYTYFPKYGGVMYAPSYASSLYFMPTK